MTSLIASQELHLPIGKPIKADLRSIDVLHDFTVPAVPGEDEHGAGPRHLRLVHADPGRTFDAFCEQLCGIAHYAMRGKVVVEDEAAFQTWLGSYPTFAQTCSARSPGDAGGRAAGSTPSARPATARKREGNPALNAPKLSGQGDWYLKRQLQ